MDAGGAWLCSCPGGRPGATVAVVAIAGLARSEIHSSWHRTRPAAALPLGCLDSMGNQGACLVRTGNAGTLCTQRGMVRRQRCALLRCIACISANDAVAAGLV